jgi:hypothetical protein
LTVRAIVFIGVDVGCFVVVGVKAVVKVPRVAPVGCGLPPPLGAQAFLTSGTAR